VRVYFPPFNLAACVVGEYVHAFSFLGQVGAAFLAVRCDKLALTYHIAVFYIYVEL
jgi:hypothetical protein